MATVPTLIQRLQTQRPSAREVKRGTGFSDVMVDDYLTIFENFALLANGGDNSNIQIVINKNNIQILFGRVDDADEAIVVVNGNIEAHKANDSAHGVVGDNVGTGNYCTAIVGGVVDLAGAVANANSSTVDVVNPDAPPALWNYSQIDTDIMVNLINEQKAAINQLTSDLNAVVTQLNRVITNSKTAKQMASQGSNMSIGNIISDKFGEDAVVKKGGIESAFNNIPVVSDVIEWTDQNLLGGKEEDAAEKAAKQAAAGQQSALDYQIQQEALPTQFREGALTQLGGLYGLEGGEGSQQMLIDQAMASPLYQQIMAQKETGQRDIAKHASVTGIRGGNTSTELSDYAMQLENRALTDSYNQQLQGLQGMAGLPSNTNAISSSMANLGAIEAQGTTAAAQARADATGQLLGVGTSLLPMAFGSNSTGV